MLADISVNERFLCRAVRDAPTVVWGVYPPVYSKEDGPYGVEDVVGEEEVGEV